MPFSTSSPLRTTLNMKFKKALHQVFLELLSTLLKWLISLTKLVPNSVHSSLLFWTLKTPLVKFITTWFKPLLITTTFPIISNHWWKVFTLTSKPLFLQMNFALRLYLLVVVYSKVIALAHFYSILNLIFPQVLKSHPLVAVRWRCRCHKRSGIGKSISNEPLYNLV